MAIHRRRAGQTLAEVAIVLPLLLLMMFGLLELGWAIYQSNVIRGYVREASNIISRNGTIVDRPPIADIQHQTPGGTPR